MSARQNSLHTQRRGNEKSGEPAGFDRNAVRSVLAAAPSLVAATGLALSILVTMTVVTVTLARAAADLALN